MDKLILKSLKIFVSTLVLTLTIAVVSCLEGVAKIEVVKRTARSITSEGEDYDYDVMLNAFDSTHHLKLRSAGSILSSEFRYHEIDVDENEQTIFNDVTPNARELREIEGNIYVDSQMNTAVRLLNNLDGNIELEGYVNGARLRRQNGEHFVQLIEIEETLNETENSITTNHTDYVELHRPMSQPRGLLMNRVLQATPEILVVIDYENSKRFNFDKNKIIEYLAIFYNSVNNRYSLNTDPKITCQLVGVHIIKSLAAQPFIEKNKNPGKNNYDLNKVLTSYGEWIFQNMKILPKHDTASLITAIQSDGSLVGWSPVRGACWFNANNNRSAATSVAIDNGGIFKGAWTVAHELAHNLGAPHDGDGEAVGCPWSQGYLMSYEGWGTLKKFALSKCSQNAIKKFIASSGGACILLKTAGARILKSSKTQVGDIVNGKKMCEYYMKDAAATELFQQNPNDVCLKGIKCKLTKGTTTRILGVSQPPGNNIPCGEGGKCNNGKCVGNKNVYYTMDQLCVKLTDKAESKVYYDDPNLQCKNGFRCKIKLGGDGGYSIIKGLIPKDGTPCGEGGKCGKQKCMGQRNVILSMDQLCVKIIDRKDSKVYFEDPNVQCSKGFRCKIPSKDGLYSIGQGIKPNNGTPCGEGGKCNSGKCVGQKNSTMDQLCVKIVDKKDSKVYFDDPNVQCSKGFKCKVPSKDGLFTIRQGIKPSPGTPCGDGGKCQNNACVGGKKLDFTKICKTFTEDPKAGPSEPTNFGKMCQKLTCRSSISGKPLIYPLPGQTPNGTLCGNKGGVCQSGKCTKP